MSKIKVYLLAFLVSLTCLNVYSQGQVPTEGSTFNHTIESGQTVYSIATMYGVTVEDIYALNPGSKETIRIGETLRIPQPRTVEAVTPDNPEGNYTFHNIQPRETLYSLTIKYGVPASAILEANPGLSVSTFQIGKTIRIPVSIIEDIPETEFRTVVRWVDYRVPKRETLYNITRKYNIPSDELIRINPQLKDGIKEGMVIKVPIQTDEPVASSTTPIGNEREVNSLLNQRPSMDRVNMVKVALLLPFMENRPEASDSRFVEYYEGFLLAVDSLKNLGVSTELSVFDIGEGMGKINSILAQPSLRTANIIIGGGTDNNQIAAIAAFARQHNIKYIIPFSSGNDEVLSNPELFQVNPAMSYLYPKAAEAGCNLFATYNIIFLNVDDAQAKPEFTTAFKNGLRERGIPYKELTHTPATFANDLLGVLNKDTRNLIVPSSSSREALNKFRSPLRGIVDNNPAYRDNISLFGYPDWQAYIDEALDDFYALDTYIYSKFYAQNLSFAVKDFYRKYRDWYSKMPANTYPKYSLFGFDSGMFFINAIKTNGTNFENSLDRIKYESLQTGFDFKRVNNWGGFINTNLFIIHYNKLDYSITRREIK
ncbi:MAG: LysM peptidoglycan-binding domain-containing protein [Tannerellaceae bacterium]|nr:LysM peptidoglycan-binding domain-containing protein [Tannerellaceae bacterium]